MLDIMYHITKYVLYITCVTLYVITEEGPKGAMRPNSVLGRTQTLPVLDWLQILPFRGERCYLICLSSFVFVMLGLGKAGNYPNIGLALGSWIYICSEKCAETNCEKCSEKCCEKGDEKCCEKCCEKGDEKCRGKCSEKGAGKGVENQSVNCGETRNEN